MKGIIERIEGEYAIIYINDEYIDFPKKLLPQEATEGTHLKITIEIDRASTEASKKTIEGLLDKLKNKQK